MIYIIYITEWITKARWPLWRVIFVGMFGKSSTDTLIDLAIAFGETIAFLSLLTVQSTTLKISISVPLSLANPVGSILMSGIIIPYAEEFLFLGILAVTLYYSHMQSFHLKPWKAFLVAGFEGSFIFAIYHWLVLGGTIGSIIYVFVFRFVTIYFTVSRQSIVHALIAHTAINITITILSLAT